MYEEMLKMMGLNSIEDWMTTIAKMTGNNPMKPKTHWALHAIKPSEVLSEKLIKKYNIHRDDRYYQLRKDNEPMSDEWFRKNNMYCTNERDFDKERYLVLVHMRLEKYSDYVIETCDLKSPWHFEGYECVFDKERGKIIYEVQDSFENHLYIHGNLLEHRDNHGKGKFINMVLQSEVLELESYEYWEGSDRLFIRTPKYGDPQKILTITYEDCKIQELDSK